MKKLLFVVIALATIICSCNSDKNKFKVSGVVDGGGDTTVLYLETSSNGNWYIVDSVVTDDGKFSFVEDAIEFPNIYRLVHRADAIYFPIDSIDKLEIKTDINHFAENYTISGSKNAEKMMKYEKELEKFVKAGDLSSESFKTWKKNLSMDMVNDLQSIVSYYYINKYIGDTPLFDPDDKQDFKIIGAVTNAFAQYRKNDPRTNYLVKNFEDKLRLRNSANTMPRDTVYAEEIGVLDFKLSDKTGNTQSFKDVCSRGNVVLLNFTILNQSFSPVLNKTLNDAYSKYHSKGLEIYQVFYDEDVDLWRKSVDKLPWIVTWDSGGMTTARLYNVTQLPMALIINRNGDIVQRLELAQLVDDELLKIIEKKL